MTDLIDQESAESNGGGMSAPERILTSGRAVQKMQTSYATAVAVQRPRDLKRTERALLQEATLAGEDFYYGWSVKDNKGKLSRIEGPSVDLANAAARCWGNCAVESLPVQDAGDSWIFTGAFVDLETGFTMTRQFRQSKASTVFGRMDNERKDDIRFQIGQSKAIRNVVLNALPPSLIRHAMEEAKKGVRAKLEKFINEKGLPAAIDIIVKELGKLGVKEAQIIDRVGVVETKAMTVDHLVMLRGDLTAIQSGQEYAETLFPVAGEVKSNEALKDKIKGNKKDEPAKAEEKIAAPPSDEPPPPQQVRGETLAKLQELISKSGQAQPSWRKAHGIATWADLLEQDALRYIAELEGKTKPEREAGEEG